MRGRDHDPYARLSHRHGWIADRHREYPPFEQTATELLSLFRISKHYRSDGRLACARVKSRLFHPGFEVPGVVPEFLHELVGRFQNIHGFAAGSGVGRSQSAREEEGAPLLAQVVDDDLLAGCKSAHDAEGLR